jgi:hypothetical protein
MKRRTIGAVWLVAAGLAGGALGIAARSLLQRSSAPTIVSQSARAPAPARGGLASTSRSPPANQCLPRFVEIPADVQQDPSRPGYDPRKVLRLGGRAGEIFAREPRNNSWASGMERGALADGLADLKRLVPDAPELTVECRTLTCLVKWRATSSDTDRKISTALKVLRIAPSYQPMTEDGGNSGVYLVYRPKNGFAEDQAPMARRYDVANPDRFRESYRQIRAAYYADLRAGRVKLPPILGTTANIPQ